MLTEFIVSFISPLALCCLSYMNDLALKRRYRQVKCRYVSASWRDEWLLREEDNLNQQYIRLFGLSEHFDVRCSICGKAENMSTSSEIVAERIGGHPGTWKCKECQSAVDFEGRRN